MVKGGVDTRTGVPGNAGCPCPPARPADVDEAALQYLQRFAGAINWCINSHGIPHCDRADVWQDVRIKVLKRFRKWGPLSCGDGTSTYIYAIARSVCLNYIRAKRRYSVAAPGAAERLPATGIAPDEWLHRQQAHERLHLAVATLPPMSRAVMRQVLLGRSLKEIAERFGLTEANAKVIAHRARLLLRKRLVRP